MKHVTIKDVAKRLNVSVSSVSRAFNDKYDIKKETKELILRTAKEMGYHPNPIARKLMQQKSYNIGVVVPEFINEFFSETIIGIQDVLISKGYQVLIMQSNEHYENELMNVKTLSDNMVDGLIVSLSRETHNTEFYLKLLAEGYPIIFFNRINDSLPASKVIFNDFKWSFFATEHLIKQGFKKIYHLSGQNHLSLAKNRMKGFQKAIEKYDMSPEENRVIETGLLMDEGDKITQELIDNQDLPEAFSCVNDPVALGAMRALKRNKIKIPEEVGVVGFTETRLADLVDPSLTSVKQPTYEIGKTTAELLLKQINNGFKTPETVSLDGQLNIRASSVRKTIA
ncbi:LacI family DNA-binding transcriptional regulator [Fulvivirgaceae bacterium BMA10]|uniref:LacI family DNA-binding transcriptional regulator n=1 Tax=Splendidivirga corallicola TaxID=3051826 RepID=A0ABT8KL77_9BACT|nr:LacI family DNA-binding transcriptional regulator [Fulvivirgaceae bacterium BMA10]